MQEAAEAENAQVETFLNSVPLLKPLSLGDKQRLIQAFEEVLFPAHTVIITEGEPGDKFYIVKRCARTRAVQSSGGGV
jgi:hypothetical protein